MARRRSRKGKTLAAEELMGDFLGLYRKCPTYWYFPKARVLSADNLATFADILKVIFDGKYLGQIWSRDLQDELLSELISEGHLSPYKRGNVRADRTALTRIWVVLLQHFGFIWTQPNSPIFMTESGFALIEATELEPRDRIREHRRVIDRQIKKFQYPHPKQELQLQAEFNGLLPYFFLLQVLRECDFRISFIEYELFVNLASSHGDLEIVVGFINQWRTLDPPRQQVVIDSCRSIAAIGGNKAGRFKRVSDSSSYQRAVFCFPDLVRADPETQMIIGVDEVAIHQIVESRQGDLKVTPFANTEDWMAYYGDPAQEPSRFTFLANTVRDAISESDAISQIGHHDATLTGPEKKEIKRLQLEKAIESSYAQNVDLLHTIEPGLQLLERQKSTPIGRIDLLCRGTDGKSVVIEIKAGAVDDAAFGQVLRYMGWIHAQSGGHFDNVRGILMAGQIPTKAHYSRRGLMRDDYREFLKFHRHGFAGETI